MIKLVADTLRIDDAQKAETVAQILGQPVASIHRLAGGRNSQVYQVVGPGAEQYAAKFYAPNSNTGRSRLEAEYGGLDFLWEHGERAIPRPIAQDKQLNCAIYEFVDGTAISPSTVIESDIQQAVAFIVRLKAVARKEGAAELPPAAEACFSTEMIIDNLGSRKSRLEEVTGTAIHGAELQSFFKERFDPVFDRIVNACSGDFGSGDTPRKRELEISQRTLSPSDFGFHNAVKQSNGRIVFLDFEYFGWDDPAKMISDFLLHPAMDLKPALKQSFFTEMLSEFSCDEDSRLRNRIQTVYPLFGLKWCLIMLNEFIPEHSHRRGFAQVGEVSSAEVQARQLSKAELMLKEVIGSHDCFPYRF